MRPVRLNSVFEQVEGIVSRRIQEGSWSVVISENGFCWVQLDDEVTARRDQASFHVFAEGAHSDIRGQIYNLAEGGQLTIPHERWPLHLFLVIGITGSVDAEIGRRTVPLRPLSQLLILPGMPCRLTARSKASLEVVSLRSHRPPGILG
jgi:hypothetical protein